MKNYDYVKTILYVYPRMEAFAEAAAVSAENKALLSFRDPNTLCCMEQIVGRMRESFAFREIKMITDGVLSRLTRAELYLVEYKYFRRKKMLYGEFHDIELDFGEREYFRRQQNVLKKIACLFLAKGINEESFFERYMIFSPFLKVYRGIKEGRERLILPKRDFRPLRVQGLNAPNKASASPAVFP